MAGAGVGRPSPSLNGKPELAWVAGIIRAAPVALAMPRSATAYMLTLRH